MEVLLLVQVGSFNYDNSKMVFNDEFIADETKIRSVLDYSIKVSVVEEFYFFKFSLFWAHPLPYGSMPS
jgi:hypothetical protein